MGWGVMDVGHLKFENVWIKYKSFRCYKIHKFLPPVNNNIFI